MPEVRQRHKPSAVESQPAGLAFTEPEAPSTKTVKIDCHLGHVGVTCSNNIEPPGVLLDHCHPADLAAKAGLRQWDVVITANGTPVLRHESFIEAISAATNADADSAARFLEVEYLPAASVAAAQAVARARRPPQKSLTVAYALAFVAPPLGLHHVYLGRDSHAVLHLLTFGLLGLGWMRDLLCLPRYVITSNEDPAYVAHLQAEKQLRPTPSGGVSRLLAMLILGWYFGLVLSCVPPPPAESPWPLEAGMLLEAALQSVGAAVAVYLVGVCPSTDGSLIKTMRSALAAAVIARFTYLRFIIGGQSSIWAALGATRAFRATRTYALPGTFVQRRVRLSAARRLTLVVSAASVGWGAVGVGLYQRGGVTVRTADGGMQTVRFKDAVHHVTPA